MKKYNVAVSPIVEEVNERAFQIAGVLSVLGLISIICAVAFFEVGTVRSILVSVGLGFLVLPFALRFFINKHKKIGSIRFTEHGIDIKIKEIGQNSYEIEKISSLKFDIVDYEGETKAKDLVRSSTTMNIRTGAENWLYFNYKNDEFFYQFKLENELEKRKALYFLNYFSNCISEASSEK